MQRSIFFLLIFFSQKTPKLEHGIVSSLQYLDRRSLRNDILKRIDKKEELQYTYSRSWAELFKRGNQFNGVNAGKISKDIP
jgi:hypothetical protein